MNDVEGYELPFGILKSKKEAAVVLSKCNQASPFNCFLVHFFGGLEIVLHWSVSPRKGK